MKIRVLGIFLTVLLIIIGLVLMPPLGGSAMPSEESQGSSSLYFLTGGTLNGSNYSLVVDSHEASSFSSGQGYHLFGSSSILLQGSGCCCLYLPCTFKGQ